MRDLDSHPVEGTGPQAFEPEVGLVRLALGPVEVASSDPVGRSESGSMSFRTLYNFHHDFAYFVIIMNAVMGIWVTAAHWLKPLRGKPMWWCVIVAQVSIFIQVIAGVIMVAHHGVKVEKFHMFYGFVAIAAVGIIYSYRSQMRHKIYLLYGVGSFFLMGLGIRAMLLATPT